MIRSYTALIKQRLLPEDFDPENAIRALGDMSLYDDSITENPVFKEIVSEFIPGAVIKKLWDVSPTKNREIKRRIETRVPAILSGNTEAAQELASDCKRELMRELPAYLRFILDGGKRYLIDHESVGSVLRSTETLEATKFLPDGCFEILLPNFEISQAFMTMYGRVLPGSDLAKASIQDSNVSVVWSKFIRNEEEYKSITLSIHTPKGEGVQDAGLHISFHADTYEKQGYEAAFVEAVSTNGAEVLFSKEHLITTTKALVSDLLNITESMSKEFFFAKEVNPRETVLARTKNVNLSTKKRNIAKSILPKLPDMTVIAASRSEKGLPSFNTLTSIISHESEMPQWSTTALEATVPVVVDVPISNPRARNLHGALHPQILKSTINGLGLRGYELHEHGEIARSKIRDLDRRGVIEDDAGNEVKIGAEGIKMDTLAIDMDGLYPRDVEALMTIFRSFSMDLPLEERTGSLEPLQGFMNIHRSLLKYHDSGSQCFLLNGEVAQMMQNTELSDIDICDLKLPYDAMYLGFESPVSVDLDGEPCHFDGAYLSGSKESLEILLTFSPVQTTGSFMRDFRNPLRIELRRYPGVTLDRSILAALEDGGYDLERGEPIELPENPPDSKYDFFTEGKTSQENIVDRNERLFGQMVDAVTITANTIMAMTAAPEAITVTESWHNPSRSLKDLLEGTSAKSRQKALTLAQRENAMPVRVISLTQEARDHQNDIIRQVRKSPEEAYWRKGHWRHQAYGPKMSLRRWRWIEPKLCNEDAELKRTGTVYHAKASELDM